MSLIMNPEYRKPTQGDKACGAAMRAYFRLRTLDEGNNYVPMKRLRAIFGVNGVAAHARIAERLDELEARKLVTWYRYEFGGHMHYRVSLEPLHEELPEHALEVPKTFRRSGMTDEEKVMKLFRELQEEKLGRVLELTIKDWQNCRRLLKSNGYEVVREAVRQYWRLRAEHRKSSDFNDFKFQFASLGNDAVDELETKAAVEVAKKRREQPKVELTEREHILKELATARRAGIEKSIAFWEQELEELDGEEEG